MSVGEREEGSEGKKRQCMHKQVSHGCRHGERYGGIDGQWMEGVSVYIYIWWKVAGREGEREG